MSIIRTYYNEFDPMAAAWLHELQAMGEIPEGRVDDRSIAEVRADDIGDVAHFFAGIGGWAYALKLAEWDPARPVWTASLPCQPFSAAGKRKGHEDERHLWPVFYDLVRECRPATILGEQVAGRDGAAWFSAVRADLEEIGYACGAVALTAAGIGAPHIRQRLYWVAYSERDGHDRSGKTGTARRDESADCCGDAGGLGHAAELDDGRDAGASAQAQGEACVGEERGVGSSGIASWNNVVYISCADGKSRPLPQSGIEPLVDGLPADLVRGGDQRLAPERTAEARAMRLSGYGNAIVPQLAALFIKTFMDYDPRNPVEESIA